MAPSRWAGSAGGRDAGRAVEFRYRRRDSRACKRDHRARPGPRALQRDGRCTRQCDDDGARERIYVRDASTSPSPTTSSPWATSRWVRGHAGIPGHAVAGRASRRSRRCVVEQRCRRGHRAGVGLHSRRRDVRESESVATAQGLGTSTITATAPAIRAGQRDGDGRDDRDADAESDCRRSKQPTGNATLTLSQVAPRRAA